MILLILVISALCATIGGMMKGGFGVAMGLLFGPIGLGVCAIVLMIQNEGKYQKSYEFSGSGRDDIMKKYAIRRKYWKDLTPPSRKLK